MTVVQMLVSSGKGDDSQWFDYRPSFYGPVVRIEWEHDTMEAAIESSAADYLIKHGYAKRVSPEPEPEPLIVEEKEEPLVVETIDHSSSSVPSKPAPDDVTATPPPSSPPPPDTPRVEATESTASGGGKHKKKEKSK